MGLTQTAHFESAAGSLALNFINTVGERPGYRGPSPQPPQELLATIEDLSAWCTLTGCLSPAELRTALKAPSNERSLKQLRKERESLFSLFRGLLLNGHPHPQDLATFNQLLSALPPLELIWKEGTIRLAEPDSPSLSWISGRVIRDAAHLLTETERSRLRFCAGDDCGWIFRDTSKNGKRRWCSMSDCGNRDKVQRFLARARKAR